MYSIFYLLIYHGNKLELITNIRGKKGSTFDFKVEGGKTLPCQRAGYNEVQLNQLPTTNVNFKVDRPQIW